MIERQIELKRRHHRKLKMRKLKVKLAAATGDAKTVLLYKIRRLSPAWTEASMPAPEPAAPEPKKKAAGKPKAEKK